MNKKNKQREKNREAVMLTLPSFINQLLLLMNSGIILRDAIFKIGNGYRNLPEKQKNYFTVSVTEICDRVERKGGNLVGEFYRFSRESGVRELTRVANILMENQTRGTNLWGKLAEQGDSIWEERRLMGEEKIRLSETRMSFPLAMMLIALLIVTAAPAMMSMGGI